MILARQGNERYWIRWTGKKWVDKAGHEWKIDGLDLISVYHGKTHDWRADVFPVDESNQEVA